MSYNTSKSAVLQMARSMACELGPKGIRVNTLSPGHIYTSYVCTFILTRKKQQEGWMGASQIGVNEPDCAEWNKEAIGTGAQSWNSWKQREKTGLC